MAQPTNSHSRYDLSTSGENVVDDVHDIIINISPTETPFHTMCRKETATSDQHEFLSDSLAAAVSNNQHIDGDDFSGDAQAAPVRLSNYCEIGRKDIVVTRRADKVKKYGRKNELAYLLAKAGKELKRDCEKSALANKAAVQGNDSTASVTAGAPAWFRTNTDRGTSGADPTLSSVTYGYPNAAATDGTDRALSEATLQAQIRAAWEAGGEPSKVMVGPQVKQRISNYLFTSSARVATPYQDHGANKKSGITAVGAADIYVTDFGVVEIIPNRFQREDDVFIFDPAHWAIAYLDGFKTYEIAKSGDSEKRMMVVDWGVVCRAENASAIVADVDETTAMVA